MSFVVCCTPSSFDVVENLSELRLLCYSRWVLTDELSRSFYYANVLLRTKKAVPFAFLSIQSQVNLDPSLHRTFLGS